MWNLISLNRILTDKEKNLQRQKHLERLKSVKGRVNNKPPLRPSILYELKPRIQKAKLQRNKEIEHENENLLHKMIEIDKRPSKLHPIICRKDTHYPISRSLNRSVRYKELDSIYEQNRRLLQRLQQASSVYSLNKWEHEFAQNSYYGSKIKENSARMGAWGGTGKRRTFSPDKQNTSSMMSGSTSTHNVNKTFSMIRGIEIKKSQEPSHSSDPGPQAHHYQETHTQNQQLNDSARHLALVTPGPYSIEEQRRSSSKSSTPAKIRTSGAISTSAFPPHSLPQEKEDENAKRVNKIRRSSPLIQGIPELKRRKEVFSSHSRHLSADVVKKPKVKSRKKSQRCEKVAPLTEEQKKEEDIGDENKGALVNMASPKADAP